MKKAMILSGAGLSAESGLKTFRASDGLWEEYDIMEICSATGFRKNPQKVLEFYNQRRTELAKVEPNYAHKIIARLKNKFKDRLFIITQNVDDLLERANCEAVVHLHGFLPELYCSFCAFTINIGHKRQESMLCPKCHKEGLRHNIVMFEEAAPQYEYLYQALNQSSLFVCIGSSGAVLPLGHFARACEYSILNNLEANTALDSYFNKVYLKKATEAIDAIADEISSFLDT